ncbi:hypothetical protein [Spirosoma gilvum]
MKNPHDELLGLALAVVNILEKQAKAGQQKPPWEGYQNQNGQPVGLAIEHLINKAKRIIQTHVS